MSAPGATTLHSALTKRRIQVDLREDRDCDESHMKRLANDITRLKREDHRQHCEQHCDRDRRKPR